MLAKVCFNHEVTQGTVLVPLIFLLYVKNFSEKNKGDFELVKFADDTSILCRYESGGKLGTIIGYVLLETGK